MKVLLDLMMKVFIPKYSVYKILILLTLIFSSVFTFGKLKSENKEIKIGLLISGNNSNEARWGAELAVLIANERVGKNEPKFQLITRSLEGPWGTGSKEAVDLIFKEKVWAILGSHDGRNAHLVEQATAKAHVVFLSAWASDPTLSQAFIPWYFSCVPNDNQQAAALIDEISKKREIDKIAMVSDESYDAKMARESFLKGIKAAGNAAPIQLSLGNEMKDFTVLLNKIGKTNVKCIVLFAQPSASERFITQMRQRKMNQVIYSTLLMQGDEYFTKQFLKKSTGIVVISSGNLASSKRENFQKEFQKKYNQIPGAISAYAYDGMSLLIEAIRNSGFDRSLIQNSVLSTNYEGVTGLIQFDQRGNRKGPAELTEIKNSIQKAVEK